MSQLCRKCNKYTIIDDGYNGLCYTCAYPTVPDRKYKCYICHEFFLPNDLYVTVRDFKSVDICKPCSLATKSYETGVVTEGPKYKLEEVKPAKKTCPSCLQIFWSSNDAMTMCLSCSGVKFPKGPSAPYKKHVEDNLEVATAKQLKQLSSSNGPYYIPTPDKIRFPMTYPTIKEEPEIEIVTEKPRKFKIK